MSTYVDRMEVRSDSHIIILCYRLKFHVSHNLSNCVMRFFNMYFIFLEKICTKKRDYIFINFELRTICLLNTRSADLYVIHLYAPRQ